MGAKRLVLMILTAMSSSPYISRTATHQLCRLNVNDAFHPQLPRLSQNHPNGAGPDAGASEATPSFTDGLTNDDTVSIRGPRGEVLLATLDRPPPPASSTQSREDSRQVQDIRSTGCAIPENLPGDYRFTTLDIDHDGTSPIPQGKQRNETESLLEPRLLKRGHDRTGKSPHRELKKRKHISLHYAQEVDPSTAPASVPGFPGSASHINDVGPAQDNNVVLLDNARNAITSRDLLRNLASRIPVSGKVFTKYLCLEKLQKDRESHPCYRHPPGDLKAQIIHLCEEHGDLLCPYCVDKLSLPADNDDAYNSLVDIVYGNEANLRAHMRTHVKPWSCSACNTRLSASSKVNLKRHKCKAAGTSVDYTSTQPLPQDNYYQPELRDLDKIVATCKKSDDYRQKIYDGGKLVYEWHNNAEIDALRIEHLRRFLAGRDSMTSISNVKSTQPTAVRETKPMKIIHYSGPRVPEVSVDIPNTGNFRIMNLDNTCLPYVSQSQQLYNKRPADQPQATVVWQNHSHIKNTNHAYTGPSQNAPQLRPSVAWKSSDGIINSQISSLLIVSQSQQLHHEQPEDPSQDPVVSNNPSRITYTNQASVGFSQYSPRLQPYGDGNNSGDCINPKVLTITSDGAVGRCSFDRKSSPSRDIPLSQETSSLHGILNEHHPFLGSEAYNHRNDQFYDDMENGDMERIMSKSSSMSFTELLKPIE
ncbi:hypothetical protein BZA77DRAFT_346827 [Pyronema omphalodes]|nr:hypothetical protein BZA77DRAFT_346827 [Pyronema omphalodes]